MIKFDDLNYPVSMSAFAYGEKGEILVKGNDLKVISDFSFSKTMWYLFYGNLSLSDNKEFVEEMNQFILKNKGDAMINFKIQNQHCFLDLFIILNYIPLWPNCHKLNLSGEVVRVKSVNEK